MTLGLFPRTLLCGVCCGPMAISQKSSLQTRRLTMKRNTVDELSKKDDVQSFPEDLAIRGLPWTEGCFPGEWFTSVNIDEEEKYYHEPVQ